VLVHHLLKTSKTPGIYLTSVFMIYISGLLTPEIITNVMNELQVFVDRLMLGTHFISHSDGQYKFQ